MIRADESLMEIAETTGKRLLSMTTGCRPDMHEPDEQGVSAHVVGTALDNAMGDGLMPEAVLRGYQEITVVLHGREGLITELNLASLLALAREGARCLLDDESRSKA